MTTTPSRQVFSNELPTILLGTQVDSILFFQDADRELLEDV